MSWQPSSFVERIGAALVAPRAALAAADEPEAAGRTGTDAALLLLFTVLALHTKQVVIAVWLAATDSVSSGAGALVSLIGRSVGTDLVFILVAGLLVTIAAGRRRSIGRDFDLACVAYVPFVVAQLAAYLVISVGDIEPTRPVTNVAAIAAFGWALAVVALGVVHARSRGASTETAGAR